jgi:hypothetical protein
MEAAKASIEQMGYVRVSKAMPAEVVRALLKEGYEQNDKGTLVRLPLAKTLADRLGDGAHFSSTQLAVPGATKTEVKASLVRLAKQGIACCVIRNGIETWVARTHAIVEVKDYKVLFEALQKAQKKGLPVLLEDLQKLARPLIMRSTAVDDAIATIGALADDVGLAFIPRVVDAMFAKGYSEKQAVLALEKLAHQSRIELRPESGMDRLTARELTQCPCGPHGTRLSWLRVIGVSR